MVIFNNNLKNYDTKYTVWGEGHHKLIKLFVPSTVLLQCKSVKPEQFPLQVVTSNILVNKVQKSHPFLLFLHNAAHTRRDEGKLHSS